MDYSFGNWVRKRRKALDLTQQELAQRVGCSVSLVFKIEADERRPSRQIARLLADILDIPADQHALFLKIARQEKSTLSLDEIPPLPKLEPAPPQKPDNLPVPPTPLVGREHEINVITRQLLDPACRMLTLTGPGGVGKTRLSIETGRKLETRFTDGIYFISLAGVSGVETIVPTIAETIGLSFSGPAEPITQVLAFLRTKDVLLVLDNLEQLIEGANLLSEILQNTQRVKMLVTSREQLHLQWEWIFEVQGLPIPESRSTDLEKNSATSLFIQRARQASQIFSVDGEDVEAIIRICKLVEGLPLAIELAASWARLLTCREIAQEIEQGLNFLESKKLDIPQRHRSLKAVFDHSWALLDDEERVALKRLSVFRGGFTRDAASSVAGATLAMLSSLVDKSLLRFSRSQNRYNLHEVIRQNAYTQLASSPNEASQTSEKFALHFADWVAALEAPFKSAEQAQTSQVIRSETSNWLSGWHWAVTQHRLDILRKMSPCLNWYFEVHGYYDEALSAFTAGLNEIRTQGAPGSLRSAEEKSAYAGLVDQVGWFEFRKGNTERGIALLAESLEIARDYDDPEILYYIYGNWGYLALMQGNIAEADRLTRKSLEYGNILNSAWHIAIPANVLGIVAYQQGKLTEAYQQLSESLRLWRSVGDPRGLVFCMLYLGMTTFAMNEIEKTRSILQESNAIAEANMDRWAYAFGLDMLGMIELARGKNEDALGFFKRSIALSDEIGDQLNVAQTTIHLGQAYAALQATDKAQRIFLDVYASARDNKWIQLILNTLVSFTEMQNGLSPEAKLAIALSLISHSSITPYLRSRGELLRDEILPGLTAEQVEMAQTLATQKSPEEWAQEIFG